MQRKMQREKDTPKCTQDLTMGRQIENCPGPTGLSLPLPLGSHIFGLMGTFFHSVWVRIFPRPCVGVFSPISLCGLFFFTLIPSFPQSLCVGYFSLPWYPRLALFRTKPIWTWEFFVGAWNAFSSFLWCHKKARANNWGVNLRPKVINYTQKKHKHGCNILYAIIYLYTVS